jgi:hypothetical protein
MDIAESMKTLVITNSQIGVATDRNHRACVALAAEGKKRSDAIE